MPVLACTGLWGHVILHTLAQRHLTPGASSLQGAHGVPENSQESHTVAWGRHTVSFAFSSFPSRLPLPRCPLLVLLLQTFLLSTNSISLDATEHFSSLWEWQTWKFLIFFFFSLVCLLFYFLLVPPQSRGRLARTIFTFPILWYFPINFVARIHTYLIETNLKSLVHCNWNTQSYDVCLEN